MTSNSPPRSSNRTAIDAPRKGLSSQNQAAHRVVVNSLGMSFVPVPGTQVLFCIHETRWKDYASYAKANPGVPRDWQNQTFDGIQLTERPDEHPVVNVNWEEATRFCEWLSRIEGKPYRLPTDREWSAAVGLREAWQPTDTPETVKKDPTQFPWGRTWPIPGRSGNYSDQSRRTKAVSPRAGAGYLEGYDDGFPTTAPVMSFAPNQFGLFDLGGNVKEWVLDSWNAEGTERVLRDHAWHQVPKASLASSIRLHINASHRDLCFGFRIVLDPAGS